MYRVVLLTVAKSDIKDTASWYENKKDKLGKKFLADVSQTTGLIKRNPYGYTVRYDDIRTAVLDVFPFMIHYRIDELDKLIIIAAVLHTSRNPDIWTGSRNTGEL